jgi:hypothetical protein
VLRSPDKILDLFQAIGYSLFQCQALEETIVHCLLIGPKLSRDSDSKIVEDLFKKTGNLTFGQLVSQLSAAEDFPPLILEDLKVLKGERNWLAHRSWKESLPFANQYPPSNLDEIIRRVMTIADEALRLNKLCAEVLEQRTIKSGVSKEELDRIASDLYRKWIVP